MPESNSGLFFLDSNVWLYGLIDQQSETKFHIARQLIEQPGLVISVQVVNEVCVNLLQKGAFSEEEIVDFIHDFYESYSVLDLDREVLTHASRLRQRYSLSYWDSLIVASALDAAVDVLYSEDMQHGLIIEDRVVIRNPFANGESS